MNESSGRKPRTEIEQKLVYRDFSQSPDMQILQICKNLVFPDAYSKREVFSCQEYI
jgi:hypothetical protein